MLLSEKLKENPRGTNCQTSATVVLYCYTITKINIKTHEMKELKAIIPNLLFKLFHALKTFLTTMVQQVTISKASLETGNICDTVFSVILKDCRKVCF